MNTLLLTIVTFAVAFISVALIHPYLVRFAKAKNTDINKNIAAQNALIHYLLERKKNKNNDKKKIKFYFIFFICYIYIYFTTYCFINKYLFMFIQKKKKAQTRAFFKETRIE